MRNEFSFWDFSKTLNNDVIKFLLDQTKDYEKTTGRVGIGESREDTSVRQVDIQSLGEFHFFSLMLYAYGIHANSRLWNFKIEGPLMCDLLTYTPGHGKYDTHLDILQITNDYTRKLTVLALLNDDFEGGKFYFDFFGKEREYVPLEKGSVIVFPSYFPHGVEPVTAGERKSCVTFLIGPNFK